MQALALRSAGGAKDRSPDQVAAGTRAPMRPMTERGLGNQARLRRLTPVAPGLQAKNHIRKHKGGIGP